MKCCVPSSLLVACAVLLSLLLGGCGGGTETTTTTTTTQPGAAQTTVLLFRHCARSMPEHGIYDIPGLPYFNNYSHNSWPPFSEPAFYCLPRGEEIVESSGRWLKANAALPAPITAVADDCQRDNVTGRALLRGLGLTVDSNNFVLDAGPFGQSTAQGCPKLSTPNWTKAMEAAVRQYPLPVSLFAPLQESIFKALGVGAAGKWNLSTCALSASSDWWAPYVGACQAFAQFTERFLMEWAGGMDIGWGQITPQDIPKLLALHGWYLKVTLSPPELVAIREASILRAVLASLEAGEKGTKAFVGHDTNIGGFNGALGLRWDPSPFPENATLPGSGLRFDRQGDMISASYLYVNNFTQGGEMKAVPARFSGFASDGTISLKSLRELVEKNTVAACANKFAPGYVTLMDDLGIVV